MKPLHTESPFAASAGCDGRGGGNIEATCVVTYVMTGLLGAVQVPPDQFVACQINRRSGPIVVTATVEGARQEVERPWNRTGREAQSRSACGVPISRPSV
jgi:hypothetical protein